MASPIKERNPLQLRAEKLLTQSFYEPNEEEYEGLRERDTNEPLFEFFKRKVKYQLNYYLNKETKQGRRRRGQLPPRDVSPPKDDQNEASSVSPKRSTNSKKSKELQVTWKTPKLAARGESLEDEEQRAGDGGNMGPIGKDLEKLKEVLNRRHFTIESSAAQIRSQRKVLAAIRVTTNREQLVQLITDLEEANSKIVDNLEGQLLNLQDAFRQIDKVQYQLSLEHGDWERRTQELLRDRVSDERTKAETQIASMKELNESLKREIRAIDRPAMESKLAQCKSENEKLKAELTATQQTHSKKANEATVLNNTLQSKDIEISRLTDEIEGLQSIIKEQNESHKDSVQALELRISALTEEMMQERQLGEVKNVQMERFKDQELIGMRREMDRMRGELDIAGRNASRQEDILHVQIAGLKHELAVQEDRNKAIMEGEQSHKSALQQTLYEREQAWMLEKQKMLEELETKEKHRLKQKNEWAEIYSQLKQEISDLKKRMMDMGGDNEKLMKQLERSHHDTIDTEISLKAQNENYKTKLRERETETGALWEVIQDLQRTQQSRGKIDIRDLQTSLVLKNLDEKARKKLR